MSVCRSCLQAIDWIKTIKGKNMPVDPDYITHSEAMLGDILVTDAGNVITVQDPRQPNVKGRISHFATCPEADTWKNRTITNKIIK